MNKNRFVSLRYLISSFSDLSVKLLLVGLPTVLVYLFALLFMTISAGDIPGYVLAHIYSPMLEYIIMTLTIPVVGALVADIASRKSEKEGKDF